MVASNDIWPHLRAQPLNTLLFYKNLVYKNVKAWIVKKNKNISEGYKSGLFLNLAYVLMNRYQGLSYLTVLKHKQKYNLKESW